MPGPYVMDGDEHAGRDRRIILLEPGASRMSMFGREGVRTGQYDRDDREREVREIAPGRSPLTARLPPSPGAIARALFGEVPGSAPAPVAQVQGKGELDGEDIHATAAQGLTGPAVELPFLAQIQRAFGHHEISGIRAHIGGPAAAASAAMNARAYAAGDAVAFASDPDLHTAAHEAAHVVQQRGGVRLAGGVGRAGDEYERHADAVADAVVRGDSAEALLDRYAHRGPAGGPAVQKQEREGTATQTPATDGAAPSGTQQGQEGGTGPAANLAQTLIHVNGARSQLVDGNHSIFGRRQQAVEDFVAAQREEREADADLLVLAAQTGLAIAGGRIEGIVADVIGSTAFEIALAAFQRIERLIASETRTAVQRARSPREPTRSLARFAEMQIRALQDAGSRVSLEFSEEMAQRFASAPNGVEQARQLERGYQQAQPAAYEEQSIATHAQWAQVLRESETFGEAVERRITGDAQIGTLSLEFSTSGGRLRVTAASQSGMSPTARERLVERRGTLQDLRAAGNPIECRLVWSDWRPFLGESASTIYASRDGVSGADRALAQWVRDHYVPEFDIESPQAAQTAAAIIWSREIMNIQLQDLPDVGD